MNSIARIDGRPPLGKLANIRLSSPTVAAITLAFRNGERVDATAIDDGALENPLGL